MSTIQTYGAYLSLPTNQTIGNNPFPDSSTGDIFDNAVNDVKTLVKAPANPLDAVSATTGLIKAPEAVAPNGGGEDVSTGNNEGYHFHGNLSFYN